MAKQRSKAVDFSVYVLIRLIVCFVRLFTLKQAKELARGLAWLLYHVDKRHRLVAMDNLRHAFGQQYSDLQRDQIVRGVYRHFCTMLMEIVHLPKTMHPHNWKDYMCLENAEELISLMLSKRPVMLVTGHLGNWEIAGYALGLFGFKTHAIARPLDNPYLDRYLREFREKTGQKVLAKKGDFDQMQEVLALGGTLATLADQDAGQRGLFVDFFGRPASTHKAIALLAIEYNVPLVVVGVTRRGQAGLYQITVQDVIYPEQYAGAPDAVRAMTQRFTTGLEELVRQSPEQYFWLHRRWKHQPPVRKAKKCAA